MRGVVGEHEKRVLARRDNDDAKGDDGGVRPERRGGDRRGDNRQGSGDRESRPHGVERRQPLHGVRRQRPDTPPVVPKFVASGVPVHRGVV